MGTTLALVGAYNLAGALKRHSGDHTAAFAAYEAEMRPIVQRAQKLAPGAPHSLHPETAWGLWFVHVIGWLITISGLQSLLFRTAGPPADEISIRDHGFKTVKDGWMLSDQQ